MPKRVLTGTVVSDKGDKTVVVRVERRVKHPLYGKIIKLSKKYHAHDAATSSAPARSSASRNARPISKLKTWKVVDRIGSAKLGTVEIADPERCSAVAEPSKPAEEKAEKPAKKGKKAKAEDVAEADA